MTRHAIISDEDGTPLISIGRDDTVQVLAAVALAQVERMERLFDDDAGDVHDPAWWRELAREADDLATSARAVAISLEVRADRA